MKTVDALIRNEKDGSLSFGNYALTEKTKVSDFKHAGDIYKVKSFNEITKLEKNENFVFESVPGSAVFNFKSDEKSTSFSIAGNSDVQITLELEPDKDYQVKLGADTLGTFRTNLGGKLVFSVDAHEDDLTDVVITEA